MKRLVALVVILGLALSGNPVLAAGFGISPAHINLGLPTNGSVTQDFKVYDLNGTLHIDLEDIPLKVEPTEIEVRDEETITLTFYGDGTSKSYVGKVRFLAVAEGNVATGIKVKATVTQFPPFTKTKEASWLPFVIVGILLVVVLFGSIYLVRRKRC